MIRGRPRRILHVNGDWKWTGPAEPMLELVRAQRAAGLEVALACPEAPSGSGLAQRAREAGVEPALELAARRGARPWRDRRDARALTRVAADFDLLHSWHTRDSVLAWRAARALARRGPRPWLVRSWWRAEPIPRAPWQRWLVARADGLLCVGEAAARAHADCCRAVAGTHGAVDAGRFAPGPPDPALRARLGLGSGSPVLGIVARVQRHRRFDLLIDALGRLAAREPRVRLLVLGRGTHLDEVARQPAARAGLAERVCFAGHRAEDYVDALRCIDVFTFLVPGSDGSCRAVLEAHAVGLPTVATRRGPLPEIVSDGETGLLVDDRPDALAGAWGRLLGDPDLRARMGRAARERALREFGPERLEARTRALYDAAASLKV